MSAELDMSQYIDLFLQEGEEQIEILEQELLKLESDPTDERMQTIFRAAHTLKGSSRAMGFSNFAELTHEMENVLDQLRNHTIEVDRNIANSLLGCIDKLSDMMDSIRSGEGDKAECADLVEALKAILSGKVSPAASSQVGGAPATAAGIPFPTQVPPDLHDALTEAKSQGAVYHVQFRLTEDCVMKFVRAFMAVSVAQEDGEILACHPNQEMLEEEEFDRDFELVFTNTGDMAEIRSKFEAIGEVDAFVFGQWGELTAEPGRHLEIVEGGAPAPVASGTPAADPAPAAQTGAAASATPRKADTGQTVRVDVARLDNLMNLVGELVIDRTRIAQIGTDLALRYNDNQIEDLGETVSHIGRITSDLQDQIMKARMLPIETVFNRFPRVVRDLAQKLGKEIQLNLVGGETELDRSVIEVIGDPLLHILRNSIDHGVEMPDERIAAGKPAIGTVTVSAKHQENHIVIEIIDDGKGINLGRVKQKAVDAGLVTADAAAKMSDKEALQFIFHSGLSTAAEVSEVSGRGVGMDIVRSNIQKLGGLIDLDTAQGKGTRFSLRLPLTLAIIRGLLVDVAKTVFVLPLGSVVETLLIKKDDIQRINQREVVVIRGVTTPLVRMGEVFGRNVEQTPCEDFYVVIVGLAEKRMGLIVDKLIGEQEVVIKSLSRFCGDVAGVSGATILGDGNVALIADINGIVMGDRG
ncbi:MAG: chemotaxis protein CheA [Armatimonadetes bacterium]|nr:chemotaxis protein CheA [Armatimonadota bacterium]